jgi:hypothetical protein
VREDVARFVFRKMAPVFINHWHSEVERRWPDLGPPVETRWKDFSVVDSTHWMTD